MGLRLHDADALKVLADKGVEGREELERKLAMFKCSSDLTQEEKDKNIDLINFALSGGVQFSRADVHEDIKAGKADTDDIGGM